MEEFQVANRSLENTVYYINCDQRAVDDITSYGSTNPKQVEHQLTLWRDRLSDVP
jgi:hypothetical protein